MDSFEPIGYLKTCFASKNGTPRQPTVSSVSKGELKISKTIFNNPEHSVEDLEAFSHVWILFVFHLNSRKGVKAKVKPPRMNGLKTGVFSTRSPHRPNPIGLTLAKLDSINGDTLNFSGLDIVDGTPVLDIKPYIPSYDSPKVMNTTNSKPSLNEETFSDIPISTVESTNTDLDIQTAQWINEPPVAEIEVQFTNRAFNDISRFKPNSGEWVLRFISPDNLKQAIIDVLTADPRSSYRRQKCSDRLYYFTLDNAHITAWFDDTNDQVIAEVLRIKPLSMIVK
ncbi:tRNA (adenine(37)-N6)-methyltransferase-like [Ciona intestinalis]